MEKFMLERQETLDLIAKDLIYFSMICSLNNSESFQSKLYNTKKYLPIFLKLLLFLISMLYQNLILLILINLYNYYKNILIPHFLVVILI